jgi:hypothetical protein
MGRMRRINIVIDPELDDRLEREAVTLGVSKSALVRDCLRSRLGGDRADAGLVCLPVFHDVDPFGDLDTILYGPLSEDAWPSSTRRSS